MKVLPLLKPSCTDLEIELVESVLRSGWWGQGSMVEQFEREMGKRYGKKHCITTNSATAALHLACKVAGIGPGDEVIVPALTFISTALAAIYCGAKVIFADVYEDTLCVDMFDVEKKFTRNTKMVIPVDYAGYPCMNVIPYGLIPHRRWTIVQDAAHSCGGLGYGDMICLSFHPVKNLATFDGGCILTDNDEWAERARALRWCGINKSTWERSQKKYGWDYQIEEVGYKYHFSDVGAAIALAQLSRLDDLNQRRREIAMIYNDEFSELEDTGLVQLPVDHWNHTWHLYPIRVDAGKRNALIDWLLERGISAGVHYKPLTEYSMYNDQPTPPVTEREWQRLVSLPIYYDLEDSDVERVADVVKAFFS